MRKDLKNGAAELQEKKIMLVVQLALLAIQLAWLIASLFGALAIPLVVGGFRAIITALLRNLFVEVGQEIAQEPLLMIVIQAAQDADGVREGIDWDAIKKALIQTVIAAGVAGVTNFAADNVVDWAARRIAKVDRVGVDGTLYITDGAFRAGALFTKGGAQAAVAMPAEAAGQVAVGAPIEWKWGTATSAFVGGLYEGNAATPGQLLNGLNLPSLDGSDEKAYTLSPEGDGRHGSGNSGVEGKHETPYIDDKAPDGHRGVGADDAQVTSTANSVIGTEKIADWDTETLVGDEKGVVGTGNAPAQAGESGAARQSLPGDTGIGTGRAAGLGSGGLGTANAEASSNAGAASASAGTTAGSGVHATSGEAAGHGAGTASASANAGVAAGGAANG
ncbi:hypothetical protein AB0O48_16475, partial [Micromonospora sp. NPDC085948]